MSRKKKETDVQANGTHEETTVAVVPAPPLDTHPDKPQPLVSYRLNSDRTTSISLAVWANTYTNQQGEEYEQLTLTVQRSYKDQQGQWQAQVKPSWRVHDLPVLLFLIEKAHSFGHYSAIPPEVRVRGSHKWLRY